MNRIRFLFDENDAQKLADALVLEEPAIEVFVVGQLGEPPKGTPDPELLKYAEVQELTLVTLDKRSMPVHVKDHLRSGRHTCGVIIPRRGFPYHRYIDELLLIWFASQAEEWKDRFKRVPL